MDVLADFRCARVEHEVRPDQDQIPAGAGLELLQAPLDFGVALEGITHGDHTAHAIQCRDDHRVLVLQQGNERKNVTFEAREGRLNESHGQPTALRGSGQQGRRKATVDQR